MNATTIKKRYDILSSALFLVIITLSAILFLLFYTSEDTSTNREHIVRYSTAGYDPSNIEIRVGDTVTFVNESEEEFWPASDPHPTHTALPSFDPRRPVGPGEKWSYTFLETGPWGYHDHYRSNLRGTVNVVGEIAATTDAENSCLEDPLQSASCTEQKIIHVLETDGISAALSLIGDWHNTYAEGTFDCHGAAHDIGEAAFYQYSQTEEVELSANTSYCGFGFFHGFMETLLLTTGDIQLAQDFCEYVDQQPLTANAGYACFHGVGHGAVDGYDPTTWGDPDALLAPGLEMCDTIARTDLQHYLCITGAYDSLGILSRDSTYGIDEIYQDPYAFCNTREPYHREPCYTNLLPLILTQYRDDIEKTFQYIETNIQDREAIVIEDRTTYEMVMEAAAVEFVRVHRGSEGYQKKGIEMCRRLAGPQATTLCINGIGSGHLKYGNVKTGYEEATAFCTRDELNSEEQMSCLEHFVPFVATYYGIEVQNTVCDSLTVPLNACSNRPMRSI